MYRPMPGARRAEGLWNKLGGMCVMCAQLVYEREFPDDIRAQWFFLDVSIYV